MSNQTLLELATAASSGEEVRGAKGLRPAQCERLREAIRKAASLKREEWPAKRIGLGKPREDINQPAFEALRRRRDEEAARLGVEPTILATRSVLETLANDSSRAEEVLMTWQRVLLFGPGSD
jgi:ribonuclease D